MPAVKVSVQAMMLQMAAAKQWGQANFAKLDPLTVGMSPPDATIALLSDSAEITSVFSVPPFQYQQLEKPGIHTVLNSYEVFGGPHTFTVAWTSTQFRDKNPALYKALIAAFQEATEMLNKDVKPAAQYWIDDVKSKTDRREGGRDRLRQRGEMDDGAGEHDEIRRVHARGRLHQDHAGELEGPVLPRGARAARQLKNDGARVTASGRYRKGRHLR